MFDLWTMKVSKPHGTSAPNYTVIELHILQKYVLVLQKYVLVLQKYVLVLQLDVHFPDISI